MKSKVMELSVEEFGSVLKDAKDQIDHGSVAGIEELIEETIDRCFV